MHIHVTSTHVCTNSHKYMRMFRHVCMHGCTLCSCCRYQSGSLALVTVAWRAAHGGLHSRRPCLLCPGGCKQAPKRPQKQLSHGPSSSSLKRGVIQMLSDVYRSAEKSKADRQKGACAPQSCMIPVEGGMPMDCVVAGGLCGAYMGLSSFCGFTHGDALRTSKPGFRGVISKGCVWGQ